MEIKSCFFVLALVFLKGVCSTEVSGCNGALLPSVNISGCDASPCTAARGTKISVVVSMLSPINTKTMVPKLVVAGRGFSVAVPLPPSLRNACGLLTKGSCPLKVGDELEFSITIPILEIFPTVTASIEVSLSGDGGKKISCFNLVGTIVRSKKN